MNYPGEVRYVDPTGNDDWEVYVRDTMGIWRPVNLGGPGFLVDNTITRKAWREYP